MEQYTPGLRNTKFWCLLGFKCETVTFFYGIALHGKPLEECPKPKTYAKLSELRKVNSDGQTPTTGH